MNTRFSIVALLALSTAAFAQSSDVIAPTSDVVPGPSADVAPTKSVAHDVARPTADADSIAIPWEVGYANCDGSKAFPTINANDLICFLNRLALGDPYANCDGSTMKPYITANDFQCFLNAYAVATAWESAIVTTSDAQ